MESYAVKMVSMFLYNLDTAKENGWMLFEN